MKLKIIITDKDVIKAQSVVHSMQNHPIVKERYNRNIKRNDIILTHNRMWERQIGCLLTTRQNSSINSPVHRFIHSRSPLLSLSSCKTKKNLAAFAKKEIERFGGIRFATKIGSQIAKNFEILDKGGWKEIDDMLKLFKKRPQPPAMERQCAELLAKTLSGFGPKQSRNLLQWLGVTQYEIPIDTRLIKWIKTLGDLNMLTPSALSDNDYYCAIMDAIIDLCNAAEVFPCIFDASVFASLEKKI